MGLEYPEAATHFWSPGYERVILPRNWQSFNFYDLEICVPSFAYQVGVPENTEEYRVVDSSFDKLNQELKDFQFDGLATNTLKLVTGLEIDLL
ncbi:MAG: hypothetical protein D9N14_01055 [Ketobacter sp.]|nr:MAG: hypothetical protein D9N14_01055 [Ketobacter sp.]